MTKGIFNSAGRCTAVSDSFGIDIPDDLLSYRYTDLLLSGGVVVYSPAAETLEQAKLRGSSVVNVAYESAVSAWVPDGNPGTYSYHAAEILELQDTRSGAGSVTVTQKTIAGGETAQVSVNDAAFKVVADSIADFVTPLIAEYDGYLSDIAAAGTVEAVNAILENL